MATVQVTQIKNDLHAAIAYAVNEKKTNDGIFTSSNCGIPFIADSVYEAMRETQIQAELNHSRGRRGIIFAHHLIQSFLPGEVDAKTAHDIGVEFAEKILGGNDEYDYVIATHTDKPHMHNHIMFSPVNRHSLKRYRTPNNWLAECREISDQICKREGLSVIPKAPHDKNAPTIGELYSRARGHSGKASLAALIDYAIAQSVSWESFAKTLEENGVKTFFKGGQVLFEAKKLLSRPVRGKTLGIAFTEHALMNRIGRIKLNEFVVQKKMIQNSTDEKMRVQLPGSRPPLFIFVDKEYLIDHKTHWKMFLPTTATFQPVRKDGSLGGSTLTDKDFFKYFSKIDPFTKINLPGLQTPSTLHGKTQAQKRRNAVIDRKVKELKITGTYVNLLARYNSATDKSACLNQFKTELAKSREELTGLVIDAQKAMDLEKPLTELNEKITTLAAKTQILNDTIEKIEQANKDAKTLEAETEINERKGKHR